MYQKRDASKSVAFSKRRNGLYSKTAQLCRLSSGAQVAILATPTCSKSNVSFYSFGHSCVDSVVSAFLKNQRPQEDHIWSEFWWEDESLANSEDPKELSEAVDSVSRMLQNLRGVRDKSIKKKELVVHGTHQSQALNLQPACASICIHDDPPVNVQGYVKNVKVEDQIIAVSDNNNDVGIHRTLEELGQNQTLDFHLTSSASHCIHDVSPEKGQIVAVSDSRNNLDAFNQELDIDSFIDFEMNPEGFITRSMEMDDVSVTRYSCSELNEDQIGGTSDNNNNALPGVLYVCNEEVDMDQIFDLVAKSEGISTSLEMVDVSIMLCYMETETEAGAWKRKRKEA